MSEPQDNPNRLGGLKEYTENLKLITGYMRILNSNYNKKKDETIRVLKKAGYTIEDIKRIQEQYNRHYNGDSIKADLLTESLDEMRALVENLKHINEEITWHMEKDSSEQEKSTSGDNDKQTVTIGIRETTQGDTNNRESQDVEYVEAEIVSPEELEEMRKRQEETKYQQELDRTLRMVNEHSAWARAVRNAQAKVNAERAAVHSRAGSSDIPRGGSRVKEEEFRRKVADMARETTGGREANYSERFGARQSTRGDSYRGERYGRTTGSSRTARYGERESTTRARQGSSARKRSVRNKPKTLSTKNLVRRVAAGALAISMLAGAYAIHRSNEYKEDVENRIEYVDNIIDRNGTIQDYTVYCGIGFTQEELEKFLEVEGKIDGYQGKESTELSVVDIITTAQDFGDIYRYIVKERLEEGFGYSIDENEIKVVRERDDLDGHPGDYNENGRISQIGYMEHINDGKIPKELRSSVIAAYGGQGIEEPAMSVDELIYKLDNQEITKAEASQYLGEMLDDAKEIMTRQYNEKEYGELEEVDSTYTTVKEREEEQAKNNKQAEQYVAEKDDEER